MASTSKCGIILMNLGSPDSTTVKDVSAYLNEFLMDGRVIDYPYLARKILVSGIIVPFRAPKSAQAYKTIWTDQGSPLVQFTRQLGHALQDRLPEPVVVAMRYGNPSMELAYAQLLDQMPDLEEVIALPLYPHYAMSSYETAVEYARQVHKKKNYTFRLNFIKPYYNEPAYIDALSGHMRPYLEADYDQLLFSYHGVPGRHIRKSDTTGQHCLRVEDCCHVDSPAHATCYRHQVFETTRLVTEKLKIPRDKYSISFQSRLGKGWLEPFTDIRLEQLPAEGVKKLIVVCPAFVSDCLETLEEIADRGKKTFMQAGGTSYQMIPCLNLDTLWVDAISGWITDCVSGGKRDMILA